MRKIKRMLAVSAAALMLAGCDATPGWADEPLFHRTPVPVAVVEPETTAEHKNDGCAGCTATHDSPTECGCERCLEGRHG